ncbi:hypothetical protein WA1_42045 [Scytonema hofmannii PCC 7110]|uniref:GUN4-like domain-containing protein n=2 Tax=Scytonema hofmannii TaxID=34078 RepID=A0A139WV54_9CYAN|nr:hypothetical protein WA1_42045 [Scytonema hofmannii PCC 7110]
MSREKMMKFPCRDLQKIDEKWKNSSNGRFGFTVQRQIWQESGNRLEYNGEVYDEKTYESFISKIGWTEERDQRNDLDNIKTTEEKLKLALDRNRKGSLPYFEGSIESYELEIPEQQYATNFLDKQDRIMAEAVLKTPSSVWCLVSLEGEQRCGPPPGTHNILGRAFACKI